MTGHVLKGLLVAAAGLVMGALMWRAGRPESATFRYVLEDAMRKTGSSEEQRDQLAKQLRFWARVPAVGSLLFVLAGVFIVVASIFTDWVQD